MAATGEAGKSGHPIQVVARRTGLSPDVLRAWERRYSAVRPIRSATNRRLYTDDDIERLRLLRRVTEAGRRIGDVSGLSTDQLLALAEEDDAATRELGPGPVRHSPNSTRAGDHLAACLAAVEALDSQALERALSDAAVALSAPSILQDLLTPLLHEIGLRWREGSLRPVHEHMTTVIVRSFMFSLKSGMPISESSPRLIVTTPSGHMHELGALMAAVTAALDDWRVVYLGPNLPPEEIAAAVRQTDAVAVALSLVYPTDDPQTKDDLRRLRQLLSEGTPILVGGDAAEPHARTIDEIGGRRIRDLVDFRASLSSLRDKT